MVDMAFNLNEKHPNLMHKVAILISEQIVYINKLRCWQIVWSKEKRWIRERERER